MNVTVDDDRCRGHGVCAALCPEVFTVIEAGYAVAVSDVPEEFEDDVRLARDSCPEHAISVT